MRLNRESIWRAVMKVFVLPASSFSNHSGCKLKWVSWNGHQTYLTSLNVDIQLLRYTMKLGIKIYTCLSNHWSSQLQPCCSISIAVQKENIVQVSTWHISLTVPWQTIPSILKPTQGLNKASRRSYVNRDHTSSCSPVEILKLWCGRASVTNSQPCLPRLGKRAQSHCGRL